MPSRDISEDRKQESRKGKKWRNRFALGFRYSLIFNHPNGKGPEISPVDHAVCKAVSPLEVIGVNGDGSDSPPFPREASSPWTG